MSKFDQSSINKINLMIRKKNWRLVDELCANYISKYPNDIFMQLLYINVLLKLGKTAKARFYYNRIKEEDVTFSKDIASYYYATVKLLLQEQRYQECLDYINSRDNLFNDRNDFYYVDALCKNNLGLAIQPNGYQGYIYNQIVNYDEAKALEFIRGTKTTNERRKSSFNPEFDIERCFRIVKSRISESFKYYSGIAYAEMVFKVDNCGTYLGESTNLILVNSILNSDNILTMYPDNNVNKLKYINISDLMK